MGELTINDRWGRAVSYLTYHANRHGILLTKVFIHNGSRFSHYKTFKGHLSEEELKTRLA